MSIKNKQPSVKISFIQKIILILFGFCASIIVLEAGLRVSGFVILSCQEYGNRLSIKQRGSYRILCVGESTTQYGYPSFLEENLNQQNIGIRFRVINKGRSGTNTSVILSQIESYLDEYQPNMVVAMMGINDRGKHMPYEKHTPLKIINYLRFFKTYRLARLLWLHIVTKVEEMGLHKSKSLEKTDLENMNNIKTEDSIMKPLETNLNKDLVYFKTRRLYTNQRISYQNEESLKKAIELNPNNYQAYLNLGWQYIYSKKYRPAEKIFKKAMELNSNNFMLYLGLGSAYLCLDDTRRAGECLKKGLEFKLNDKTRIYGAISIIYEGIGQAEIAKEYYNKAKELGLEGYNSITKSNYLELKEILDKRKIKLICVQYPMRNIEPLKKIFEGHTDGIIFVDNEKSFKDAVKRSAYNNYFADIFGGNFGHCAEKGNKLLADNIAKVLLEEVFGRWHVPHILLKR